MDRPLPRLTPARPFAHSRLRIRQLLLVIALGEQRNLRRAAAALALAQPAATRQLRDLEETLGVPLFERSRKGMAPTIFGEAMIRYANLVIADLDAAREEIGALAAGRSGRIVVGATTSIAPMLLPRALARLKREQPGLRIVIQESSHELLIAALARGELDVALVRAAPGGSQQGLRYEVLYSEGFRIVAGLRHRLARAKKMTLADIADDTWILPPESVPLRRQLDTLFMTSAGRKPRDPIESASIFTNESLLQHAPFLAVMPESTARRFARRRLLAVLPIALKGLVGPVALVMRDPSPLSPAVQSLVSALRAEVARLRPRGA